MIYTSYFGNVKNILKNNPTIELISIARVTLTYFKGIKFSFLAPSYQLLSRYKTGNITSLEYEEIYFKETLSKINREKFIEEHKSKYSNSVLLCYERRDAFCHRHLVSKYLKEGGLDINEY